MTSRQSSTILVVDDNPANRDLLIRRLMREGYRAIEAEDGPTALELITREAVDLVLLDIMMPLMDGFAVLRELRKDWSALELPVIMVTAKHDSEDVVEALTIGANDYVTKPIQYPILAARVGVQLDRKRVHAENLRLTEALAEKLASRDVELKSAESQLVGIARNLPGIMFRMTQSVGGDLACEYARDGDEDITAHRGDEKAYSALRADTTEHSRLEEEFRRSAASLGRLEVEYQGKVSGDEQVHWFRCGAQPHRDQHGAVVWDGLVLDITESRNLQTQLLQAQKLESVGQLAAGIAHEINTPTQYVSDNTQFLKDAFADITDVLDAYAKLLRAAADGTTDAGLVEATAKSIEGADIEYLLEEIPKAIDQSLDGVSRISRIVSAMKEFSHPGGEGKELMDLNRLIENTLTVARNEWKYVAEVVKDLDPGLPMVPCHGGELGQVFLNLIVNAAHAITDAADDSGKMGKISIVSQQDDGFVEVRISDSGTGVPEAVRERIFDPFFTTKGVGKGTGQGLAIARSVIVDKHGGTLTLEQTRGSGASFVIQLPLESQTQDAAA